jgi:L-malate glycosyltransferase
LGLALLEAMACEVPALASDIPGVTDIVQDGRNGRLVPAKNEQAWLEAMCWVLDHPQQAHDLATCGRRTVLERFSIAAVADAHKNLFTELAARGDSA